MGISDGILDWRRKTKERRKRKGNKIAHVLNSEGYKRFFSYHIHGGNVNHDG